MITTTAGTNTKVSKYFGTKPAAAPAVAGEGTPEVEGRPCLVTNDAQEADAWCAREVDLDIDSTDAQVGSQPINQSTRRKGPHPGGALVGTARLITVRPHKSCPSLFQPP